MSLAPILQKSSSADALKCRKTTLQRSGSFGSLPSGGHHRGCPPFHLPRSPAITVPKGVAWRALSEALVSAFELSDEISPDHPAAACIKDLDTAALVRDLAENQCWSEGGYTRTVVLKGRGFEAMLLCWSPQACSPVHAHSDAETGVKSNCFMAILEGQLTETRYDPADIDDDRVTSAGRATALPAGSTAYINDDCGVHKVGNESATVPAVSLHIYAPGWSAVQTYAEEPTDASGAPIDADWGDF